jgi:hypothetical protein
MVGIAARRFLGNHSLRRVEPAGPLNAPCLLRALGAKKKVINEPRHQGSIRLSLPHPRSLVFLFPSALRIWVSAVVL